MRVPNPSPVLDKNRAPMAPEILSSTGAGVWRKAPKGFPVSSSVLDTCQSLGGHFGPERKYLALPPQNSPIHRRHPPGPSAPRPLLAAPAPPPGIFNKKTRSTPSASDSPSPSPSRKKKKYPKRPPRSAIRCVASFALRFWWVPNPPFANPGKAPWRSLQSGVAGVYSLLEIPTDSYHVPHS